MFNFLPQQDKRKLRWEYRRRSITVAVGAMIALVVIAVILLVPSYILSYTKKRAAEAEFSRINDIYVNKLAVPVSEINLTRQLLKLVTTRKNATSTSYLIDTIITTRPAGIRISSVALMNDTRAIQVQGVASARDVLKKYIEQLEKTAMFGRVDVPLSSFARESNIPFTIDVSVKKEP